MGAIQISSLRTCVSRATYFRPNFDVKLIALFLYPDLAEDVSHRLRLTLVLHLWNSLAYIVFRTGGESQLGLVCLVTGLPIS